MRTRSAGLTAACGRRTRSHATLVHIYTHAIWCSRVGSRGGRGSRGSRRTRSHATLVNIYTHACYENAFRWSHCRVRPANVFACYTCPHLYTRRLVFSCGQPGQPGQPGKPGRPGPPGQPGQPRVYIAAVFSLPHNGVPRHVTHQNTIENNNFRNQRIQHVFWCSHAHTAVFQDTKPLKRI